jgi:hypothetical protein
MMADPLLFGLLLAMAVAAAVLFLSAALMLGRKLDHLGYQLAAGINGVRRIQSQVNIRTHANRVALAAVALNCAVLVLVDVHPWWRTLVTLTLTTAVLIGYAASSVLDWRDEDRQMRMLLADDPEPVSHICPPGPQGEPGPAGPQGLQGEPAHEPS